MLIHRRRIRRRRLLIAALALGLAACGSRGGAGATGASGPVDAAVGQPTPSIAASMAAPAAPSPATAATLDLPDLSAVGSDLSTIDAELAADASGPADEGSDQ